MKHETLNTLKLFCQVALTGLICIFSLSPSSSQSIQVVTTNSVLEDMVQVLGGNMIKCVSIIPKGQSPVDFVPNAQSLDLLKQADIVFSNGLSYEPWLEDALEKTATKAPKIVLSEGVHILRDPASSGAANPYAWIDARNGMVYARNIQKALADQDPQNAENYHFNYQVYLFQLAELDSFIQKKIMEIPEEQRFLPTSLEAFRYFGSRYGLGRNAESKNIDINLKDSLYIDWLGDLDGPASTYIDMLRYNTQVLTEVLKKTNRLQHRDTPSAYKAIRWVLVLLGIFIVCLLSMIYLVKSRTR